MFIELLQFKILKIKVDNSAKIQFFDNPWISAKKCKHMHFNNFLIEMNGRYVTLAGFHPWAFRFMITSFYGSNQPVNQQSPHST